MTDPGTKRERFPDNLGELSRAALDDAVAHVDRQLRDADDETRRAIATIRLITNFPRESPWYGKHITALGDNSVTVGVVLANQAQRFESHIPHLADRLYKRGAEQEAVRLRRAVAIGKREYYAYLDALFPDD